MNFGILVFEDVEELDFVGPWEMLAMWQKTASGSANCLIVAEQKQPVRCAEGLSIAPHVGFDDCPPLDVLLVPGGQGTRREVSNPVLVDWVAKQAAGCQAVLSDRRAGGRGRGRQGAVLPGVFLVGGALRQLRGA